jgi:hypothetical protein
MQTGFCRNGINFKASKDARKSSCEAFLFCNLAEWRGSLTMPISLNRYGPEMLQTNCLRINKISGFKRLFPDNLRKEDV